MQNLAEVISFAEFRFNVPTSAIVRQEREILEPQLADLGYTDITWWTREEDSFGPLSRSCKAIDNNGDEVEFFYG